MTTGSVHRTNRNQLNSDHKWPHHHITPHSPHPHSSTGAAPAITILTVSPEPPLTPHSSTPRDTLTIHDRHERPATGFNSALLNRPHWLEVVLQTQQREQVWVTHHLPLLYLVGSVLGLGTDKRTDTGTRVTHPCLYLCE